MNEIKDILKKSKTIAIVGLSSNPEKVSRKVASFLIEKGFTVVGVNPAIEKAGDIDVYPNLPAIPFQVDIVDVFRKPEDIPSIIPDVLKIKPKVLWLQLGIRNDEAVSEVIEKGIFTIQDKCIKIEAQKYLF